MFLLTDVAIPSDNNIQEEDHCKDQSDEDIQIECQRIRNENVEVVHVRKGVLGLAEKNLKKHLSRIPGQHNIYNLQRSVIFGTANILTKVLSVMPDLTVHAFKHVKSYMLGFQPMNHG